MASVIEDILGMALIIIVVLVVGILVISSVTKGSLQQAQQRQIVLGEEQGRQGLTTILASSEQRTGQSMERLLGLSVTRIREEVVVGAVTVNVTEEMRTRLDAIYGENKTYFTMSPAPRGINLQFVIDDSPSVAAERDTIANSLADIQANLTRLINRTDQERVHTQIFVLPSGDATSCAKFDVLGLPLTKCTVLWPDQMYDEIGNWTRPSFGYATYEQWYAQPHAASALHFAQSDWAAGSSYAAILYNRSDELRSSTSLNVIIPLSDELATTSKKSDCFNLQGATDLSLCQLCELECPVARSLQAVRQATTIVNQTGSMVAPIVSINCDYVQDPAFNTYVTNPRASAYVRSFAPPPGQNVCGQPACRACTASATPGKYCYQSACNQSLQQQLQMLADGTGGQTFSINNPSEIPDRIQGLFARIVQQYNVTVGVKEPERDHFVYNELIELPNGDLGRVTLWVYK